jgi:hypothetical protein
MTDARRLGANGSHLDPLINQSGASPMDTAFQALVIAFTENTANAATMNTTANSANAATTDVSNIPPLARVEPDPDPPLARVWPGSFDRYVRTRPMQPLLTSFTSAPTLRSRGLGLNTLNTWRARCHLAWRMRARCYLAWRMRARCYLALDESPLILGLGVFVDTSAFSRRPWEVL